MASAPIKQALLCFLSVQPTLLFFLYSTSAILYSHCLDSTLFSIYLHSAWLNLASPYYSAGLVLEFHIRLLLVSITDCAILTLCSIQRVTAIIIYYILRAWSWAQFLYHLYHLHFSIIQYYNCTSRYTYTVLYKHLLHRQSLITCS